MGVRGLSGTFLDAKSSAVLSCIANVGPDGKFQGDSSTFLRLCGQLHQFLPLTVICTTFCSVPVRSELFDVALSEEKSRALNITAAWLAVDRFNYIINGACVTGEQNG